MGKFRDLSSLIMKSWCGRDVRMENNCRTIDRRAFWQSFNEVVKILLSIHELSAMREDWMIKINWSSHFHPCARQRRELFLHRSWFNYFIMRVHRSVNGSILSIKSVYICHPTNSALENNKISRSATSWCYAPFFYFRRKKLM